MTIHSNSALELLRRQAIGHSLFRADDLASVINRLGFVQADPIRAPARAQDLILWQRVADYKAGDLEAKYPTLGIEEDMFYVYGFLPRHSWELLHPWGTSQLSALEQQVLDVVTQCGPMHPKELESYCGRERVIGPWGSYARATKRALDELHYRGLLRIARRDNGIRVYERNVPPSVVMSPSERLQQLSLLIANILAPAQKKGLQETINRLRRWILELGDTTKAVENLLQTGELQQQIVNGITYIWPSTARTDGETTRTVLFLAPFDPLVWDRRRFEHLWGWVYRFEAYTPAAQRVRGYYAMPLLWGDQVIGWVNCSINDGRLMAQPEFIDKSPQDNDFRIALDAEVERMAAFLGLIR